MESCCGLPIARKHPSRASRCAPNKAIGKIASFRPNQDCDPSTSEVMAVGDTWVQLLVATAKRSTDRTLLLAMAYLLLYVPFF